MKSQKNDTLQTYQRLFAEAEIARFTKTELREYEDSLKAYRDIKNSLDSAEAKGMAKGIEKGRAEGRAETLAEVARGLIRMNMPVAKIMKITGLTEAEIKEL